ncbi:MAG: glycoside hydrolase family 16 protein [Acidimicrobiia bacterium]|nr:glycoside hydrolase family 16 protein [Acidimicrobiia bacterium]
MESVVEPDRAEPIFFDGFSLGELDRSKWNVRTTGRVVNDEQQAYIDSTETAYVERGVPGADGNVLVLHPRYRPGFETEDGQTFDFLSGRIDTRDRFQFRYGRASARMQLPTGPGSWPAFWAMGNGRWPDTGEIDIMEYVGERDWVSSAVHGPGYAGEAGLVNKLYFPDGNDATGWHTYTLDWSPDRLRFEVDGATVYRVTPPMAEFFGPWMFDNEKFLILNLALGGTYPYKTNGIRSPYYGISEETVDRIKDDEVRVLIDWVRVDVPASEQVPS